MCAVDMFLHMFCRWSSTRCGNESAGEVSDGASDSLEMGSAGLPWLPSGRAWWRVGLLSLTSHSWAWQLMVKACFKEIKDQKFKNQTYTKKAHMF